MSAKYLALLITYMEYIMKKTVLFLICMMGVLTMNVQAGLPSNEKLKALKRKVDQELDKYFRVQNAGGNCLEVDAGQVKQHGAIVTSRTCSINANQKWKLVGAQVKLAGGMCLEPAGDPSRVGVSLQIANCDNSAKQKWNYENLQLKTSANICVEVLASEVTKNGARVQTAPCAKGVHQQWKPN